MKISQDIRAAAEAGMQEKAREFRDSGGELYVPKIPNS
jgi:phosphomethylpyrimidine synthase